MKRFEKTISKGSPLTADGELFILIFKSGKVRH